MLSLVMVSLLNLFFCGLSLFLFIFFFEDYKLFKTKNSGPLAILSALVSLTFAILEVMSLHLLFAAIV